MHFSWGFKVSPWHPLRFAPRPLGAVHVQTATERPEFLFEKSQARVLAEKNPPKPYKPTSLLIAPWA
jgi:hypothetical protein